MCLRGNALCQKRVLGGFEVGFGDEGTLSVGSGFLSWRCGLGTAAGFEVNESEEEEELVIESCSMSGSRPWNLLCS